MEGASRSDAANDSSDGAHHIKNALESTLNQNENLIECHQSFNSGDNDNTQFECI